MRHYLAFIFCIYIIEAAAQEKTGGLNTADTTSLGNEIVLFPDSAATPQGGLDSFYHYVAMNIQYPKEARKAGITGRVIVAFVVEKDGNILSENITILKSPHVSLSEEAVRLINEGPKWLPGKVKGLPVRSKRTLPLSFNLGANNPRNR